MLKRFAAFQLILAYSICLAASAQQRVIHQDHTGLNRPAETQIPGGSLSRSAQGYNGPSGQLPNVQLGPHVQPGDSTSRAAPVQSHTVPQSSGGLAPAQLGPHVMPGDSSRSDLNLNTSHGSGLQPAMLGPRIAPGDRSRGDMHPEYYKRNNDFWRGTPQQSPQPQAAPPARTQPATEKYDTVPSGKIGF